MKANWLLPDARLLWIVLTLAALAAPSFAQPADDPSDLDQDGQPGVALSPQDPGPAASALVGSGALLIDRFHANDFDVSGFTNFLAANGWTVAEHTSRRIDEAALDTIDVLLVPGRLGASIFTFTASEVAAIQSFLARGGGLWVLHDAENPTGVNTLSTAFGVTFQYDYVRDPSNNEGYIFWPTIHLLSPHAITTNVETYGYYAGDCLAVTEPAQIVGRADEDSWSLFCPVGSMPPTLAVWEQQGRAVFAGDETPLHPSYYPNVLREEEEILLQNIANWLLGDRTNANAPGSWGRVKTRFTDSAR
jgi:hypothetical protein